MPDEEAWADYNFRYFVNAHGGGATDDVAAAFHSAMGQLRVAHVLAYVREGRLTVSSVLEVGPGHGEFARHWLAHRSSTTYRAVESDTGCHPRLAALGIHLIDRPEGLSVGTSVDLVVLSHVLEHVTDPIRFLGTVTAGLRSGGVLFIEVPCRDWEHKTQDEPHLLFFDKVPMGRLLGRAGFAQLELTYHGQEIAVLRRRQGFPRKVWNSVRSRLLSRGVVAPFDSREPGLDVLEKPLERAAIRPFEAHRVRERPAWWLRAMAVKQ